MIDFLTGTIQEKYKQEMIIAVGQMGFSLLVPENISLSKGEEVTLVVYLHWNQESGPSLFGFKTSLEREIFLLIISCSGIGPKIALAILGHLGVPQFIKAVKFGDEKALSKVSGIGLKKAEQMIVQLKHKVEKFIESDNTVLQESSLEQWALVTQALESLNYSRSEITAATRYLHEKYTTRELPFDGLMRHALSFLSKKS